MDLFRGPTVRRKLIQTVLPLVFCAAPPLAGVLIAVSLPEAARDLYVRNMTALDRIIIGLGSVLFVLQLSQAWRALRWRGNGFDERPDLWLSHLAQAAEWFPLLGLIGTVAAILQTFNSEKLKATSDTTERIQQIITLYGPAITATGSGLFMALLNILPTWVVMVGRDLIRTLSGDVPVDPNAAAEEPAPQADGAIRR
jgi:hypothetical protein